MPVYDGEAFLAEAIESFVGQTLRDIELVVVDDGSMDRSREIVDRFAQTDSRVTLIATDKNLGVSAALNRGWKAARAPYIAILHADDVALPDRCDRQARFLDENPSVALVGGAVITIDVRGHRGATVRFPTASSVIHSELLVRNCFAHPSVMLRRAALEEVGGYRFRHIEDYDLWLRLSERFELANIPEPLTLYRLHPGQVSLVRLEEMERLQFAVRDAAIARRAGLPDPFAQLQELRPEIVDVDEGEVARAVEREWMARAAILAELDADKADELVRNAARTLGRRAPYAFAAARELLRAEARLGAGRPLAGVPHVALAFWHDPVYASQRLASWLRLHLLRRWPTRRGKRGGGVCNS